MEFFTQRKGDAQKRAVRCELTRAHLIHFIELRGAIIADQIFHLTFIAFFQRDDVEESARGFVSVRARDALQGGLFSRGTPPPRRQVCSSTSSL